MTDAWVDPLAGDPLADQVDVERVLARPLTVDEATRVVPCLRLATAAIRTDYRVPDPVPPVMVDVCAAAAARLLASPPPGVRQESVGQYSVTYAELGDVLTAVERAALRTLRRRHGVGTIATPSDPVALIGLATAESWWGDK